MTGEYKNVDSEKLAAFSAEALKRVGVPEEDARITADLLVAADLRGIDSHGVAHLKSFYINWIRQGNVNLRPNTQIVSKTQTTAVMDGDGGLGFVVGHRAMTEAMRRAQEVGAGFVTVRNSTHLGAGAGYSMMALPRDMIGISLTTGGKLVAAPGARGRGSGVNVVSVAAPTKEEAPFVLDMATTAVAAGKIEIALRKGVPIPPGWGVDSVGEPILDPRSFFENKGALLFLGGTTEQGSYKGFGLSVMVDVLCSILSGSASITQLITDSTKLVQATHFFGAIRIDGLMPVEDFKAAMDTMIRQYKSLPRASDQDEITLAGEPENNTRKERLRNGIPLHPDVEASLRALAEELGMEYDL